MFQWTLIATVWNLDLTLQISLNPYVVRTAVRQSKRFFSANFFNTLYTRPSTTSLTLYLPVVSERTLTDQNNNHQKKMSSVWLPPSSYTKGDSNISLRASIQWWLNWFRSKCKHLPARCLAFFEANPPIMKRNILLNGYTQHIAWNILRTWLLTFSFGSPTWKHNKHR